MLMNGIFVTAFIIYMISEKQLMILDDDEFLEGTIMAIMQVHYADDPGELEMACLSSPWHI